MIVVIAEKPSVARSIANVLGCKNKAEGYLYSDKYAVTWALGHLVSLCEPQEIDEKYKKWRMEDLPISVDRIPTKVIAKTRKQYNIVKKLLNDKTTESVICATDAGREGELIFRFIYEKSACKKLATRLWISSLTDSAIKEGFNSLKPISHYDGLYESALCRAEADWIVGMNATRAFTLRYGVLLSAGRVQTPTLSILVKRGAEIKNFVKEEYYTVTADYGDFTGSWFDISSKDERTSSRIKEQTRARQIVKKVSGKLANIISINKEHKRELPPLLYDLTSLQRDCNRRLGFTAKKTLSIAQSLYENKKCITYPRTDSKYLSEDMLSTVYKTLENLPEDYDEIKVGIPDGKIRITKRVFDDTKLTDHHAIIPTPTKIKLSSLSQDERSVYDLIARRFLGAFYPPYEYMSVKLIANCEGENFKSIGREVINIGWRAVSLSETKETVLPDIKEGDTRRILSARSKKEETKPPPQHTDATLLEQMENAGKDITDEEIRESMKDSGIGTPATRAAIIERLIEVKYVIRRGKSLIATEKGEKLIQAVPSELSSPEMTGKWEKALSDIAQNKRDGKRFMQGINRLSAFLVEYAKDKAPDVHFDNEAPRQSRRRQTKNMSVNCPICGSPIRENSKAFGCSAWKKGCSFTLWKNCLEKAGGPTLNENIVTMLIKEGKVIGSTGIITLDSKNISFIPIGTSTPSTTVPIMYKAKA
ncbi:MAG TPA: DNA topoisomerase 3 [Christensenellaceae bacterium]|nr:DNA topoisomerase 3 [Christensenellaceae bacterium]